MTAIAIRSARALLELARGRDQEVLATFRAAERLSRLLDAPDWPLMRTRAVRLHAWCGWVKLGAPSGRSRKSASKAGVAARYAWPWPRCGSPRVTRTRRVSCSRRSWMGPYPVPPATWLAHACLLEAIARELSLSVHTVRTHIRHLFAKLGAHGRTEAVTRARALGLLAPSGRTT
jgi:hypothetical protein